MSSKKSKKIIRFFKIALSLILSAIFVCLISIRINLPRKYYDLVKNASDKYSVELSLIFAIIKTESNFNEKAVSRKGAIGLMQIRRSTFTYVCETYDLPFLPESIFNPAENISVGVAYISYLFKKFEREDVVLACYNAGEGVVKKWLNDSFFSDDGKTLKYIPYKETRGYVKKVSFYKNYFTNFFN